MRPSHNESGAIKKEWGGKLPVVLVYPDTYRAGMSNLAVHTLYSILNSMDNVVCERCFWRKGQTEPVSIESSRRVSDFSVIAFSVSFETDYINVVDFIRHSGVELYASRRTHGQIVIAGGIAITLNPEPIADFMDACVIGDAEGLLQKIIHVIQSGIDENRIREDILKSLDEHEGVYVPSFYQVRYGSDGKIAEISHKFKKGKKVKRHTASLSNRISSTVIYTDDTTFSGMHLQEVSKGCSYRCRFCISGYAYLPPRHRHLGDLKKDLDTLPSGVKKIGIVSPMVTDYPYLDELLDYIHSLGLKASMSSMRADSLARKSGLLSDMSGIDMPTDQFSTALAPEAGTYRLRRVLNKQLTDEQILQAAQFLNEHNIHTLKLYFLIGILGETDEDISAIAELAIQVKKQLRAGKGKVSVSINPLIPKPFTPFQWLGAIKPEGLRQRLNSIKKRLKGTGITIEWEKHYLLQAILARGDRRLSDFLIYLSRTDKAMSSALQDSGIDVEYYAFRERSDSEVLPWDFMDYGFSKGFLMKEYRLALRGIITPQCRTDSCRICGICGE